MRRRRAVWARFIVDHAHLRHPPTALHHRRTGARPGAGVVDDGVVAREVIERGLVAVNDEIETRRGRQVRPGDVVTYESETLHVVAGS